MSQRVTESEHAVAGAEEGHVEARETPAKSHEVRSRPTVAVIVQCLGCEDPSHRVTELYVMEGRGKSRVEMRETPNESHEDLLEVT